MAVHTELIKPFSDVGIGDIATVGGKNASLGEMVRSLESEGIRVPYGFATTAQAYRQFIESAGLEDRIAELLGEMKSGDRELASTGAEIRQLIMAAELPQELSEAIADAYRDLAVQTGVDEPAVAVRSSATAEDLPNASFAGQQESYLNVQGIANVVRSCQLCIASLFTDRAISYRERNGFDHMRVALSVGVQHMVRSDLAGAGVIFTLDPETGFRDVVYISAGWGLGEMVVKGAITPDEYTVFKPLLDNPEVRPVISRSSGDQAQKMVLGDGLKPTATVNTTKRERRHLVLKDDEVLELARWATRIEKHYGQPMDIEWAKDGVTGDLYIVQARPETVQARREDTGFRTFSLNETGKRLVTGLAIGEAIASGKVRIITGQEDFKQFKEGEVLVTQKTDPDWVPIMRRAAGIVTDRGGRTSHAAIVSREFGLPAIVGCGNATKELANGDEVTLSCAEGDHGAVYEGLLDFAIEDVSLEDVPETRTRITMNIASPAAAFRWWRLPVEGIGLARMEFIVNDSIKVHPMALAHFDSVKDLEARRLIEEITEGYSDKTDFFVDRLAEAVGQIAASQYPHDVILRLSDFKTNEYAQLIGGAQFEHEEENPMLGFRGASRYYNERYRDGFALECRAVKRVRDEVGLTNMVVMVPFCRTPEEADRVLEVMAEHGLKRGENGLRVYVMAEIPSNILLATEFAKRFDGFSIGSNDLTQMVLGVDRDSADLQSLFDEQHEAVKRAVRMLIRDAHAVGVPVGICGEAPSNHPEFAEFLVREGIDSISLSPDSVIAVKRHIAGVEKSLEPVVSVNGIY